MTIIPAPEMESLSETNQKILAGMPPMNLVAQLAGLGGSFPPFIELWRTFRFDGPLPDRMRELIVLRVIHRTGSPYQIFRHFPLARQHFNFGEDLLEGVKGSLPSPALSEAENDVMALVDDIMDNVKGREEYVRRALTHITPDGLRQLILAVGVYMFTGRFCETLEVETEEGEYLMVRTKPDI